MKPVAPNVQPIVSVSAPPFGVLPPHFAVREHPSIVPWHVPAVFWNVSAPSAPMITVDGVVSSLSMQVFGCDVSTLRRSA